MRTVAFVPFDVPGDHAPGLGLGLATLAHGVLRADGAAFAVVRAIAQRGPEQEPRELEGVLTPALWKQLSSRGSLDRPKVPLAVLVTGRFESAADGAGQAELLAFDPEREELLARAEAVYSADDAGAALARVLRELAEPLGWDASGVEHLDALDWETLESVFRAEAALAVGLGGSPEAALTAFVHYTRAENESPGSPFVLTRLAALAELLAHDDEARPTVSRTLTRIAADGDLDLPELDCARAVVLAAEGDEAGAEQLLLRQIERAPSHLRAYALLGRLQRERGDLAQAEATLKSVSERSPLLDNERALLAFAQENRQEASELAYTLFDLGLLQHEGWLQLCALAREPGYEALAGRIVDRVLLDAAPSAGALLRAIELLGRAEPPGVARDQRLTHLLERLEHNHPVRGELRLQLARALTQLGDRGRAEHELHALVRGGPPWAAAAAEGLLALDDPEMLEAIHATLRAAYNAEGEQLVTVAERARYFASAHGVWSAHLARVVAERRRGNTATAREALEHALSAWPGCPPLMDEKALVIAEAEPPPAPPVGVLSKLWNRLRR